MARELPMLQGMVRISRFFLTSSFLELLMYKGVQTLRRTTGGESRAIDVKFRLYQKYVPSPLLFVITKKVFTEES